jgi:hypothetical protein
VWWHAGCSSTVLLLVTLLQGVGADFVAYPNTYCGLGTGKAGDENACTCDPKIGAFMKVGATQFGTNYGFMGDLP